jgi:hypothetical protein
MNILINADAVPKVEFLCHVSKEIEFCMNFAWSLTTLHQPQLTRPELL